MSKKTGTKRKVRMWQVLVGLVVLIGLGILVAYIATEPGRREVADLNIETVDFSDLQDGVYTGRFDGEKSSLYNTCVDITIEDGAVSCISATGGMNEGENQFTVIRNEMSLNDLFLQVIEEERLDVDLIAGATLTSKSYLEAVKNALNQSIEK